MMALRFIRDNQKHGSPQIKFSAQKCPVPRERLMERFEFQRAATFKRCCLRIIAKLFLNRFMKTSLSGSCATQLFQEDCRFRWLVDGIYSYSSYSSSYSSCRNILREKFYFKFSSPALNLNPYQRFVAFRRLKYFRILAHSLSGSILMMNQKKQFFIIWVLYISLPIACWRGCANSFDEVNNQAIREEARSLSATSFPLDTWV
jgi:hypothetical protein